MANVTPLAVGTMNSIIVAAGPFLTGGTVSNGGTVIGSAASLTAHGVLFGEGTAAVGASGTMAAGQLLIGQATGDPLPETVSGDATINSGGTIALGSIVAGGTVGDTTHIPVITFDTKGRITSATTAAAGGGSVTSVVAQGGPFLAAGTVTTAGTIDNSTASLTAHGILLGEGTGAAVATAAMTAGQLLLGATGADPAPQTMSGDATINSGGTFALGSIVAGGTVGSSGLIPVITYDTKGRITAATTTATPAAVWNAGTVTTIGSGITVTAGTITGAAASNIWNAGTVTTIGSGITVTAGTITGAAASNIWNAGTVTTIGSGITVSAGTITGSAASNIWNAGTVTTIGTGITVSAGTITAAGGGGLLPLTNGDPTNPAIIFDSEGDVIGVPQ